MCFLRTNFSFLVLAVLLAPRVLCGQELINPGKSWQSAWNSALNSAPLPTAGSRNQQNTAFRVKAERVLEDTARIENDDFGRGTAIQIMRSYIAEAEKDRAYWKSKVESSPRSKAVSIDDWAAEAAAEDAAAQNLTFLQNRLNPHGGRVPETPLARRTGTPVADPYWNITISKDDLRQRLAQVTSVLRQLKAAYSKLRREPTDDEKPTEDTPHPYLASVSLASAHASMGASNGRVNAGAEDFVIQSLMQQFGVAGIPNLDKSRAALSEKELAAAIKYFNDGLNGQWEISNVRDKPEVVASLAVVRAELELLKAIQQSRQKGSGDDSIFDTFGDFNYDNKYGFSHPSDFGKMIPSEKLAYKREIDEAERAADTQLANGTLISERYLDVMELIADRRETFDQNLAEEGLVPNGRTPWEVAKLELRSSIDDLKQTLENNEPETPTQSESLQGLRRLIEDLDADIENPDVSNGRHFRPVVESHQSMPDGSVRTSLLNGNSQTDILQYPVAQGRQADTVITSTDIKGRRDYSFMGVRSVVTEYDKVVSVKRESNPIYHQVQSVIERRTIFFENEGMQIGVKEVNLAEINGGADIGAGLKSLVKSGVEVNVSLDNAVTLFVLNKNTHTEEVFSGGPTLGAGVNVSSVSFGNSGDGRSAQGSKTLGASAHKVGSDEKLELSIGLPVGVGVFVQSERTELPLLLRPY